MTSKIFKINGSFTKRGQEIKFSKELSAINQERVLDKLYCIIGSNHKVRRGQINVLSIEDAKAKAAKPKTEKKAANEETAPKEVVAVEEIVVEEVKAENSQKEEENKAETPASETNEKPATAEEKKE